MYHPQIGRFDKGPQGPHTSSGRGLSPFHCPLPGASSPYLGCGHMHSDVLIQSDGAEALGSRPKTSRCLRIADWPLSLSTVLATLYYGGMLKPRSYKARKIGAGDHHAQSHLYRVQRNKRTEGHAYVALYTLVLGSFSLAFMCCLCHTYGQISTT